MYKIHNTTQLFININSKVCSKANERYFVVLNMQHIYQVEANVLHTVIIQAVAPLWSPNR